MPCREVLHMRKCIYSGEGVNHQLVPICAPSCVFIAGSAILLSTLMFWFPSNQMCMHSYVFAGMSPTMVCMPPLSDICLQWSSQLCRGRVAASLHQQKQLFKNLHNFVSKVSEQKVHVYHRDKFLHLNVVFFRRKCCDHHVQIKQHKSLSTV